MRRLRAEQRVTAALAGFGRDVIDWIIANEFWNDYSGDDFMPLAEKHGLAQRVPYDPEKHGEIEAEEGDFIWFIDAAKLDEVK